MACRSKVRGHLGPIWGRRFAGLRIAHEASGSSLLSGVLPDQAALHGVLPRLIDPGLPLLAPETRDSPRRGPPGDGLTVENPAGTAPGRVDRGGEIGVAPAGAGGGQAEEGQG